MAKGTLAIDLGSLHTGFAVADALGISTEPLEPFEGPEGSEEILDHVEALLADRVVGTLVVGLPLNMDGTDSGRARAARAFALRLSARFPELTVQLEDERLSSKEGEELMRAAGLRPPERRRLADSYSAIVILRDYLRRT